MLLVPKAIFIGYGLDVPSFVVNEHRITKTHSCRVIGHIYYMELAYKGYKLDKHRLCGEFT